MWAESRRPGARNSAGICQAVDSWNSVALTRLRFARRFHGSCSVPKSTYDLSAVPDIPTLRKLLQSLAVLDAMNEPEWEFRYYSFNSKWDAGEMLGSMRNGSGDAFFIHFCAAG